MWCDYEKSKVTYLADSVSSFIARSNISCPSSVIPINNDASIGSNVSVKVQQESVASLFRFSCRDSL
jgi:hypothetical protein